MIPGQYLGVCMFDPSPYSRVEAVAIAEAGAWRQYSDWSAALPPEGKAFAPQLPSFHAQDLLTFRLIHNERAETGRDHRLVSEPGRAIEILDYRLVDPETARRVLVEEGIPIRSRLRPEVVVALRDGLCVVLRMERHPDGVREVAVMAGLDELPMHALDPRIFGSDLVTGRLLSIPNATVGPRVGLVNWCRDADFLSSILRRLRRAIQTGAEGAPVTRNQIPQLVSYLGRARLAPADGEDLEATTTRLSNFADRLSGRFEALEGLADAVAELRPVADRLAEREAEFETEIRARLERVVRADLEAGHADLLAAKETAAEEAECSRSEAIAARADADGAQDALDAVRSALSEALSSLGIAVSEAVASGGEGAVGLAERLERRLADAGLRAELRPGPTAPWARVEAGEGVSAVWSDFPAAMKTAAGHFGFAPEELVFADVAARSGRVVALPEDEAASFVRCLASVLTGGAWARHMLDPSVLSPDDLWRRPGTAEPTTFATAWTAARLDARRFRIVLLDGLSRTPLDLWVPAFAEALNEGSRPDNLLVFASYGPRLLDPERVWRGAAQALAGFDPAPRTRANAASLGAALGRALPTTWFDAETIEVLSDGDVLAQLSGLPESVDSEAVRRALAAVRVSCVHPDLAAARVAAIFCETGELPTVMKRGAARLVTALDPRTS